MREIVCLCVSIHRVAVLLHFCKFIVVCLCVCFHGFNYSIGILYVYIVVQSV